MTQSQVDVWKAKMQNKSVDETINLWEMERNASFGMYFAHYIFDSIRPTLPNTIDVGMIHCRPAM